MQAIELSPFQRACWSIGSLRDARLNALDVADVLDMVQRTIAAVASKSGREGFT